MTLRAERDLAGIGEAGDGLAAALLARELAPDVVVMGIAAPDFEGIGATRESVEHAPQVRVVALSARTDARSVVELLHLARGRVRLPEQAGGLQRARPDDPRRDPFHFSADIEALAPSGA
ncbi:Response regulator receiver domain-containing protein [Nannocystis exedens]|uniref:Response regulator receiver domain-containing protein n=1 Tax=Nannocystis exedens TaxID=54 RepID=A0A1I2FVH3_9BACT|nr:Response regulator receiver domain-containing protein [Nannocystis exedens]